MQVSQQTVSSIRNMIERNPEASLRHLCRLQAYVQTLKSEIQTWAYNHGQFVSADKTVKYQRRTRSFTKLDPDKARELLKAQGLDVVDIAQVVLTQESIKAKLGEQSGNNVISELMSAGAFKKQQTTYWRLQVK